MSREYAYPGGELALFDAARRWKSYWSGWVAPYIGREVLEVGAGLGANTALLGGREARRWTCLEPDPALNALLEARVARGGIAAEVVVRQGTIADLEPGSTFDTAIYIDVLEHIPDDREELARVRDRLDAGGHLIVLAPAHRWLFSAFDAAIGHHRRYTRASLAAAAPAGLTLVSMRYLDSAGLLASLLNRLVLRQENPSARQIRIWDRILVPISTRIDPLLRHRVGKSLLAVWRRDRPGTARDRARIVSTAD